MNKKLLRFQDVLNEKIKDEEFKKLYEEEGRKLDIGYKIAKLRHRFCSTQKQLAEKIHTSQTVISRLESGNYWSCNLKTLEKIALATGTHLVISFKK